MRKTIALLIPVLLLPGLISVSHGGFYRWVDEDGNVHFSDSMPPERVRSSHDEFSERGLRIKSIPAAKTREELQKEKELERLRVQQEELLEEQRQADRALLRTFRSEDDIGLARDGKIAAIDVMIGVTKNNIRRQQERLSSLLSDAANLELARKPVPGQLSDGISQAEHAIRDAYASIVDREAQKNSIRASFERDLARFQQLKDLPVSRSVVEAVEEKPPVLHNIVTCAGADECDRLWEKATLYVRQYATTPVQSSTAVVVITAPPVAEQDISLILSRINNKKGPGASLFLDLRCERSTRGQELCREQQTQAILEGFRPAILGENTPAP